MSITEGGPDRSTAPAFGGASPKASAYIALSLTSIEEVEDIEANLRSWRVVSDGDVRARAAGRGEERVLLRPGR